jgi:pyroglutamyl-peptidase
VVLPVENRSGPAALIAAFERCQPDAVLSLGEASGRSAISVERVAVNLMDYRIPDNAGENVTDQSIAPDGPAAYFSSLPVRGIVERLHEAGVPAELSMSAGTYLCNQVFYAMLHYLAVRNLAIPAGFIHLPRLPAQAAAQKTSSPSMSLETSLAGVRLAIEVIASQRL